MKDLIKDILTLTKHVELKKNEYLTENQIKRIQERKFRKILRHAYTNSSFYREFYTSHGIKENHLDDIKIGDIPPIDKKIMMENFDRFVCRKDITKQEVFNFIENPENLDQLFKNKYSVVHTSGSSGSHGLFVYNLSEWSILKALAMFRSRGLFKLFKKTQLAYIGAINGHFAGYNLNASAPNLFYDFLPVSINSPFTNIIDQLNEFNPNFIVGYSSIIEMLAIEKLNGNLHVNPERIHCSGDVLTEKRFEMITEAFGVKPVNYYAAAESIGLGSTCMQAKNIHLYNDLHVFEILDESMNAVETGQFGSLYLTTLYNFTQPLIRYNLNDQLSYRETNCKCNWSFPVIENIGGRAEDFLWFKNRVDNWEYIHPLLLVEFFVKGVEKFQFVQSKPDNIQIRAVTSMNKNDAEDKIRRKMTEILYDKELNEIVKVEIQFFDHIENNSQTGKYKLVVPYKYDK